MASLVRRVWWRVLRAAISAARPGGLCGEGLTETESSEPMERGRRTKVSLSRDILEPLEGWVTGRKSESLDRPNILCRCVKKAKLLEGSDSFVFN